MDRIKTIGLAILAVALVTGATWLLSHHTETATVSVRPSSGQTVTNAGSVTNAAAALRDEVSRLQVEHSRLADSLAAMNNENTRLEKLREQAEHGARLFKELAAQSSAQGQNPTDIYPTPRHLLAGLGKQARLMAEMEAKWGDVDEDKLPPEEQRAVQQAMIGVASEMLRLGQVAEQMKHDDNEPFPKPATPEAMADYSSCYLYGALDLDSGQFSSINGILQKYCQQAAQEHLLQASPDEAAEARTNRIAALSQLNEDARAEIQTLLSPQQAAILNRSGFKKLKFVTDKFYPPGLGFGLKEPTEN